MTPAADTVVRRQIVVQAPVERAFDVFTRRFGDFKPREHNLLRAPITDTVFTNVTISGAVRSGDQFDAKSGFGIWANPLPEPGQGPAVGSALAILHPPVPDSPSSAGNSNGRKVCFRRPRCGKMSKLWTSSSGPNERLGGASSPSHWTGRASPRSRSPSP